LICNAGVVGSGSGGGTCWAGGGGGGRRRGRGSPAAGGGGRGGCACRAGGDAGGGGAGAGSVGAGALGAQPSPGTGAAPEGGGRGRVRSPGARARRRGGRGRRGRPARGGRCRGVGQHECTKSDCMRWPASVVVHVLCPPGLTPLPFCARVGRPLPCRLWRWRWGCRGRGESPCAVTGRRREWVAVPEPLRARRANRGLESSLRRQALERVDGISSRAARHEQGVACVICVACFD
jgi:hypothetical protein